MSISSWKVQGSLNIYCYFVKQCKTAKCGATIASAAERSKTISERAAAVFDVAVCLRSFDHSISLLSYFLFWCSLLFKHDWEKKFKIGLTLAKSSTYYHYFCYYERERDGDGGRDSLFTADNWVLMGGYFEKKVKLCITTRALFSFHLSLKRKWSISYLYPFDFDFNL